MQRLDQKSQKKSKKVKKAKSHRVTKKIFGQNSQSHESRYLSQKSKSRSKSQSHFCDLTDFSISCLHQNTGSRTPTAFSSEIQSYSRPLGTTRQGGVRIKSKYFNRRQIMEALAGHNSFNRNYG